VGRGVDWWPRALIGGRRRVGRDAAAGCVSRERQNAVAVHAYNTHLISSRDFGGPVQRPSSTPQVGTALANMKAEKGKQY
jgi:hypothetical protein